MSFAVLLIESDMAHTTAVLKCVADAGLAWSVETVGSLAEAQYRVENGVFDAVLVRHALLQGQPIANSLPWCKAPRLLLVEHGLESVYAEALTGGFADFVVTSDNMRHLPVLLAKVQLAVQREVERQHLREISDQFEFALHHADLGWWNRRTDTGELHFSARACALVGYLPHELQHNSAEWLKRIHPDDLPHVFIAERGSQQLDPEVQDKGFQSEYRVRHRDGHWVWVLVNGRVMERDAKGQPLRLFGTILDVSGLRESESTLRQVARQLEEKTQLMDVCFASLSQGILQVGPDGRLMNVNQRLCDLLSLPPQLMTGHPNISEVIEFQRLRGDFGSPYKQNYREVYSHLGDEVVRPGLKMNDLPTDYWRKTTDGRYLEVKTRSLADGGWVRTVTDVSDYFEAKRALTQSEARFRSLTELSSDWFWEQDENFRFVRVHGNAPQRVGLSAEETLGKTLWEVGALNHGEGEWVVHRRLLEAGQRFRHLELQRIDAEGKSHWFSISGAPIFDDSGSLKGYQGVGQDISERKNTERETATLAFYDALTGLPNRRLMLDRLGKALESAARHQAHGALLFIDLDNFKILNDTKGHDTGDELLRQVAGRLSDCVRASDTVSRLGGDEFVVMLEDLSIDAAESHERARAVGDKVLNAFLAPFVIDGLSHQSSPSIGITLFDSSHPGVDELLKQADLAMYQAKSEGRNTRCFFHPGMQQLVSERVRLEADLRQALQQGAIYLAFQPQVDHAGVVCGAEALARWCHPELGMISPGRFIEVAEQSGLILSLGEQVLQKACACLARWAKDPVTAQWHLAVNVSARQLRQADFVERVLWVVEQAGADPARLRLELTESLLLHDAEDTIHKMAQLRAHGLGFSLDDFGTGYSSLSYLKRLPLDQLKIDRSFVRDVLVDPNDAGIARTVVLLAHSLGLNVVAEGVESVGQYEFLLGIGCRSFQGYLFGTPDAEEALLERVHSPVPVFSAA